MNERAMWKMLHVLYNLGSRPGLTYPELASVALHCGPDTIMPLCDMNLVEETGGLFRITRTGRALAQTFVVARPRWTSEPVWVDEPTAFVVMPFREPWLGLYTTMIEPAVTGAGLQCLRGDAIPRSGDLSANLWNAILQAGVVIADISAENANVFYELGLAHAVGKDTWVLRERNARVPADIGGAHWIEYDAQSPDAARDALRAQLADWVARNRPHETRAMRA